MCNKSRMLYNRANYLIRQEYFETKLVVSTFELNKRMKTEDVFMALPAKTSQQIILQLGKNWKSFLIGIKKWSNNKKGFTGKPKIPKYKDRRCIVFFDYMQGKFENRRYYFQERRGNERRNYIETKISKEKFRLLRIIPYGSCYKIEIVYTKDDIPLNPNNNYLAIDLGVNNLATLTNNIGLQPIIINGRILKSMNNYYNKIRAKAKSYVGNGTSNRCKRIDLKHRNKLDTYLHKVSKKIINYCVENDIKNIVIGRNHDWKKNVNIGKQNNQTFCHIPFEQLIFKIVYKAEENGIRIEVVDEKYTSKASFIDNDFLPKEFGEYQFSGKRIKRGLYKSSDDTLINADVNASYNILRKCNPEFIFDGIKGLSLIPIKLNVA